jgi:hypothetical protein
MIQDHIFTKHRDCDVYIDENPRTRKGQPITVHYASLRCRTCNQHLKFLSGEELVALGTITQDELDQYRAIRREQKSIPPLDARMISVSDLPLVPLK